MIENAYYRPRSGVLEGEAGGEALLVDQERFLYFGLDEVGTEAWRRLRHGASLENLAEHLLERFEVDEATLRRDLAELLSALKEHRLIEQVAG